MMIDFVVGAAEEGEGCGVVPFTVWGFFLLGFVLLLLLFSTAVVTLPLLNETAMGPTMMNE